MLDIVKRKTHISERWSNSQESVFGHARHSSHDCTESLFVTLLRARLLGV